MSMRVLDDGRYVYSGMRPCPFCGKPVAIEYDRHYKVTHIDVNPDCPLVWGLGYDSQTIHSFHDAIEKWNARA